MIDASYHALLTRFEEGDVGGCRLGGVGEVGGEELVGDEVEVGEQGREKVVD